jgi:hypothetical protein
MRDHFNYPKMVDAALRGVVRTALKQVQEEGLHGNHHLYVSFLTHYPGVVVADYLREKYPKEMTIVLQHQFWDLDISGDTLDLTLSFNKVPERLIIPYDAMTGFADPSVQFGLQFQPDRSRVENLGNGEAGLPAQITPGGAVISVGGATDEEDNDTDEEAGVETPETPAGEKVVALDQFRKK